MVTPRAGAGLALAVLGLLAGVLAGCSSGEQKAAPTPRPTPVARLNTAALQVPRIDFCRLVPTTAVRQALDGRADTAASYSNGDREPVSGSGTDVVQEIGCRWGTSAGTTARAWLFARPVEDAFARRVVAQAATTRGCRSVPGASYGAPSLTQVCRLADGTSRVRRAGLFGQTWLSCELAAPAARTPDARLRARADAWCVEVANALNTAR